MADEEIRLRGTADFDEVKGELRELDGAVDKVADGLDDVGDEGRAAGDALDRFVDSARADFRRLEDSLRDVRDAQEEVREKVQQLTGEQVRGIQGVDDLVERLAETYGTKLTAAVGAATAAGFTLIAAFRGTREVIRDLEAVGIDVDGFTQRQLEAVDAGDRMNRNLDVLSNVLRGDFARANAIASQSLEEYVGQIEALPPALEEWRQAQRRVREELSAQDEALKALSGRSMKELQDEATALAEIFSTLERTGVQLSESALEPLESRTEALLETFDRFGPLLEQTRDRGGELTPEMQALSESVSTLRENLRGLNEAQDFAALGDSIQEGTETGIEALEALSTAAEETLERVRSSISSIAADIASSFDEARQAAQEAQQQRTGGGGDPGGDVRQREEAVASLTEQVEELNRIEQEQGSLSLEQNQRRFELTGELAAAQQQLTAAVREAGQEVQTFGAGANASFEEVRDLVNDAKDQVSDLRDEFGDLGPQATRELDAVIGKFELNARAIGTNEQAISDFQTEFNAALRSVEAEAERNFSSIQDQIAEATGRQQDLTEGIRLSNAAIEQMGELGQRTGEILVQLGEESSVSIAKARDILREFNRDLITAAELAERLADAI